MKKYLSVIFVFIAVLAGAQSPDTQAIISEISNANAGINSISCDFVQTKHMKLLNEDMVSTGRMVYLRPDKLSWEYSSPYSLAFIFKENKVSINNGGQVQTVDAGQNKIFREIASMMMNFIDGRNFFDSKNFMIDVSEASECWIATLVPLRGNFKQFCSKFILHVDKANKTIRTIVMQENSGDQTVIEMKNTVVNGNVDISMFNIE